MGQVKLRELFEKTPAISIKFFNLTSETLVKEEIQMNSVSQDGCVINLPRSSCSLGHQILLKLKTEKKKIEIVGKIIEINVLNEKTCEVKVQFNQYVKEEWQYVLAKFELKQSLISEVIETLKTPKT